MSLKKYINDKSPFPQSVDEMDGSVLIFEGHDRPRYVYPLNEETGYLGLDSMDHPWFTPQFVSLGTGTLTSAKYYSIIVVPIKADISAGGLPIYGDASAYSIPKTPAASSKSINFTIPVHTQRIVKDCGIVFDSTYYQIEDQTKEWETNQFVGSYAKNVETGKEYLITANTATVITFVSGVFSADDRYQIVKPTCTARAIYACEMAAAADVSTSDFYLRDIIEDNTTTTYALTAFAESADIWNFEGTQLQPPNANSVKALSSIVFCGGGIVENRGKAKVDTDTASAIQSEVSDTGTVGAVSKFEDDTKTWTPDEFIGMTLLNSANGEVEITDNTEYEILPALIGTTKFNKTDPYYILDKAGTPDVSDAVDIVTSATAIGVTPIPSGAPVYTGARTIYPTSDSYLKSLWWWTSGEISPSQYVGYYVTASDNTFIGEVLAYQRIAGSDFLTVAGFSPTFPAGGSQLKIWNTGGFNVSEHLGKFITDSSQNVVGRVLSNSTVSLFLNAAHGLSVSDEFEIRTPEDSGIVTFPTSFKVSGKTWEDDLLIGKTIDFSVTEDKTVLTNNSDSIALTDNTMPSAGETFSVSLTMTISNPYSFSEENGTATKVARYTIAGDLEDANALPAGTYAGDYVTVSDTGTAGNNVTSAKILRVDSGGKWFEIENNSLVAGAADIGATVTITRNHITGNISGANQTYFTEGMTDAIIKFAKSGEKVFKITWVDPVNQACGIDSLYSSPVTTETDFEVSSNYPLYYSDSRNPHAWGAANIIDIYDITGFSSIGNSLLVFCKTSLVRVDIESLGASPVIISDNVRCPAQFSIVKGEKITAFYDGTGFSVTDGVSATSITAYKLREYLAGINKEHEANIRGVYDRENKRFEFVFPMGGETLNNYGVYITEGSWNCYPFTRPDCNALWTNYYNGNLRVYHGTSGDLADGSGEVWRHEGEADGSASLSMTVTAITGQVVSAQSLSETSLAAGDPVSIYPVASGEAVKQLVVKSISQTGTSPIAYDITFDDSYDLADYEAGDLVLAGYVPFDYGVKWTDFSSPQYRHQVRSLHIDLEDMTGALYIDHYLDMSKTAIATNEYAVTPSDTKIIVPFRMGKCYKYGFKLRGYSSTGVKISAFEIMYDTQV
jgi:hypothetical protein